MSEKFSNGRLNEIGSFSHPQDAQLNAASPILRLTRSGETAWGPLPGGDWTIFQANHSTYEPLAWAHRDSLDYPANKSPLATVIQVRTGFLLLFPASTLPPIPERPLFSAPRYWTSLLHRIVKSPRNSAEMEISNVNFAWNRILYRIFLYGIYFIIIYFMLFYCMLCLRHFSLY